MSFKHIKPGDQVYIVPGKRSSGETGFTEVLRVGKKYGYIKRRFYEEPFNLLTGNSVDHKDSNARHNGYGFDVWPSEEAYRAHIATTEANTRLVTRLETLRFDKYSSTLEKASPELVADLHAVLDRHGI